MYDTIEIMSPELSDTQVFRVLETCERLEKIDLETGEILFQITTSKLLGSYDSRLSVRVLGNRLRLGGSIHKFILGHNVLGGPTDIKKCCKYLVKLLEVTLNETMPSWETWELMRADIAHVFDLGSLSEVNNFISMYSNSVYPRRQRKVYESDGLYFAGKTTTLKIYSKGKEFKVHDYNKLYKLSNDVDSRYNKDTINLLHKYAERLLRVEIEVRKRKLVYDSISNKCKDLDDDYFNNLYESEILKIFSEGESDMNIVRSVSEVKARLETYLDKRKANHLFSIWTRIQVEGVDNFRKSVSKSSYYRYKKELESLGISLHSSLEITEIAGLSIQKPEYRTKDFIPLPYTRYHIPGTFCDVDNAINNLEVHAS